MLEYACKVCAPACAFLRSNSLAKPALLADGLMDVASFGGPCVLLDMGCCELR